MIKFVKLFLVFIIITQSCKNVKEEKAVMTKKELNIEKTFKALQQVEIKVSGDSIIYDLDQYTLYFLKDKSKCRTTITIKHKANNKTDVLVTSPEMCFEKNSTEDFSPNQEFLLLHAIEKGLLETGDKKEEIEKYYCIFLDINRAKLSDKHSDLFCSGEWNSMNEWVVNEDEKYSIEVLFEK